MRRATPPAVPDPSSSDVEVWRDEAGAACAYGYTTSGTHWMTLPGLASYAFVDDTDEVVAIPEPCARLQLVRDAYYRSVLPMVLQVGGLEVLHASAVQMRPGIIVLCAVSGTGKSTLAVGLNLRGYPLWADDAVPFVPSDGCVQALEVPFGIRLRPASTAFFGKGVGAFTKPGPRGNTEERAPRSVPISGVFVLRRAHDVLSHVQVTFFPPSQAFPLVLPHAYCFSLRDADRKRRMVSQYLRLVAQVPVYEIRLAPGLGSLEATLDCIERAVAGLPASQ